MPQEGPFRQLSSASTLRGRLLPADTRLPPRGQGPRAPYPTSELITRRWLSCGSGNRHFLRRPYREAGRGRVSPPRGLGRCPRNPFPLLCWSSPRGLHTQLCIQGFWRKIGTRSLPWGWGVPRHSPQTGTPPSAHLILSWGCSPHTPPPRGGRCCLCDHDLTPDPEGHLG